MIKIIEKDILEATENIICHSVNTYGIMGAGLALQIKKKYPEVYESYVDFCKFNSLEHLQGNVQVSSTNMRESGHLIANMFAQDGMMLNYTLLRECLYKVEGLMRTYGLTIAMPYNLGCGVACGDWNIVSQIIEEVFEYHYVTLYKFEPELEKQFRIQHIEKIQLVNNDTDKVIMNFNVDCSGNKS